MKNLLVVFLLLITGATTYWFWLRPEPVKIMKYEMPEVSRDAPKPPPPPAYETVKHELADWFEIGGKAVPFLSFVGALWIGRKKKKRGK